MQKLRPDMDIGHNIQRLRKASNMTQDQVIARLQLMGIEISKSTYAKIETNRMNIKSVSLLLSARFSALIYLNFLADWCRPSGSPSAFIDLWTGSLPFTGDQFKFISV